MAKNVTQEKLSKQVFGFGFHLAEPPPSRRTQSVCCTLQMWLAGCLKTNILRQLFFYFYPRARSARVYILLCPCSCWGVLSRCLVNTVLYGSEIVSRLKN